MPNRNELVIRASAVGLDPTTIPNDSKLEQRVLYLEKYGTTFAATAGSQTLTSDATNNADGETVTLGSVTYTWKTALTGAFASSTLTSTGTNVSDGDSIVIDGVQYLFRTTLDTSAQTANQILIGASASATLDNVKTTINGTGQGTTTSLATKVHPTVNATTKTSTTLLVVANKLGTDGNNILTSKSAATLSWTGTSLASGANTVPNQVLIGASASTSLDNLKSAVNADGTAVYSAGNPIHPQVVAGTKTSTTLIFTSKDNAVTNADIATTETGAHTSFGAATLASGVRGQIAATPGTQGRDGISGDRNL